MQRSVSYIEAHLNAILNAIDDAAIIADENYIIEFINPLAESLIQSRNGSVIGKSLFEVLKLDTGVVTLEGFLHKAASGNSKVRFNSTLITERHQEIFIEQSISAIQEHHQVKGYIILLKETEIKSNNLELKESEKKYRSLFDNALEGILIIDNDGNFLDANPTACEIYDIRKKDFVGKNVHHIFPHNTAEQSSQIWEGFMKTGFLFGFYKYRLRNGKVKYIDFKTKANFLPGLHLAVFSDVTEKRLTENALKMSEANLKAIFDNSIQLIILVDLNYKIITVNANGQRVARSILGDEMKTGDQILSYTGIATDEWKKKLEQVSGGAFVTEEINIPQLNDPHQWFEFNYTPVYDNKGTVKSICITATDISYRKNAELSLTESEARFRSLVQNSSDIITILSEKGTINYISPSIKNILGYEAEDLLNMTYKDFVHPEDFPQLEKIIKSKPRKDQGSLVIEYRFLHVNKYYIHLETTSNNLSEDPSINGIVLNSRDVSERKMQEENLLLLERAIDSSKSGILITDPNQPDNPVIYVNKAFENITGYSNKELIMKNCRFLQGNDREQPEIKKLRKAIKEEKELTVVLRNYKKDGTLFWNQLNISPVFNRKGSLANFIGVITDITEKKIAEDALLDITQGVSREGGKDFYNSFAKHFANILHVDYVVIGETDNSKMKTRIVYKDGEIVDNFEYSLDNSPFKEILQNGHFTHYDRVDEQFPNNEYFKKEGIKSFAASPLINSAGNTVGMMVIMRRKKIKNIQLAETLLNIFSVRASAELERDHHTTALSNSERKFRSLAENSPDLIYIIDLSIKRAIYFNWKEIFEYKSKELEVSDTWIKIVHPDDMQGVITHWAKFLKSSKGSDSIEYRLLKKNGDYEWVVNRHSVIERDAQGNTVQVLLNITIITERKKAEERLLESEARLKALVENTTDVVWSIDKDFCFTTMNAAFKNLFRLNYKKDINVGENLIESLPLSIKDEWVQLHTRALHGERFSIEFSDFAKNKNLSYEVSYNPIYSEEGQINGVSVFARDITQRKLSEDNIMRTNFELDSFVYRASHDLRAPLRSVLGLINIARTEDNLQQRNSYFDLVDKSINKLDTFISDLTNFSRNSRLEVNLEKVDFTHIINECFENLKYMENADLIKVKPLINQETEFWSDSRRISIVLQNLLSNAIKYQNLRKEDAFVEVNVQADKKEARIIVRDNGKGIKEEYLDKIFNMFFRASHDSYGSGLGLYIAKQVIEKLNGTVSVKSKFGEGTEFTIVIPNMQNKNR